VSAGNAADPGGNARKSGAVALIVDSPDERVFKVIRSHSVKLFLVCKNSLHWSCQSILMTFNDFNYTSSQRREEDCSFFIFFVFTSD